MSKRAGSPKGPPAKRAAGAPWAPIAASRAALQTSNPIRKIVDQMVIKPETDKPNISLALGDPCTDGNLLAPPEALEAFNKVVRDCKHNGYPPSAGYQATRDAVAKRFPGNPKHPCTGNDVFITSGASHAILIALDVLMNPGDNVLLPRPGFSLYKTICDSKGYDYKWYGLRPERNWECNLDEMRGAIDSRTRAILINNPSNPCGSNFSKEHVQDILRVAEEYHLPIISDEIYADMAFGGVKFHSAATLSENVPVLVVGGLAKQFVIPGWRLGWLILNDRAGLMQHVRPATMALTTLILGPCSVVQAATESFLQTADAWKTGLLKTLEKHSLVVYDEIAKVKGLTPVKPQGAMYVMVGIDTKQFKGFKSEVDFARELMREQNVGVLPGSVFGMENFFRIVFTKPEDKLREACQRIAEFCAKHRS